MISRYFKIIVVLIHIPYALQAMRSMDLVPADTTQFTSHDVCMPLGIAAPNASLPIPTGGYDYSFKPFACVGCQALETLPIDTRVCSVAEQLGYGYKTANLREIQEKILPQKSLQAALGSTGYRVEVPMFLGVSSQEVKAFLTNNGLDIDVLWQTNIAQTITIEQLNAKQLPEEFLKAAEALGEQIKKTFDAYAACCEQPKDYSLSAIAQRFYALITGTKDPFSTLYYFLAEKSIQSKPLIIRSTGKEDRADLANAGGNESIKRVQSTVPDVIRNMGKVIASYFSRKSLLQRCAAGDATIIDSPITPVLVQLMVTATAGQDKLTECIVHTTEQDGPTPGISAMNCGIGVVDSAEPAHVCLEDIDGNGHCVMVKSLQPLKAATRHAITLVAQAIEKHYGKPMDIELLVQENIIYLVQARPIVMPKQVATPSYLTDINTLNPEKTIRGTTVVAATSTVQRITQKAETLVTQTAEQALNLYLKLTAQEKLLIKAIIVQSQAEPYSHAATTFRSEGKVVIVVPNIEQITTWLNQKDTHVIIDPQRGVVAAISADQKPAESIGRVTHPTPPHVSVMPEKATRPTLPFKVQEFFAEKAQVELLELMKDSDASTSTKALASLLHRIDTIITQKQSAITCSGDTQHCYKTTIAQDALAQLDKLQKFAYEKAAALLQQFDLPARDIKRLFYIKPLENIFIQEEAPNIRESFSFASIEKRYQGRIQFIEKYLLPLSAREPSFPLRAILTNITLLDAAHEGTRVAMMPELENLWLHFVETLATDKRLPNLIERLQKFDLFSPFVNLIFNKQRALDPVAILAAAHNELSSPTAQTILQDLHIKLTQLESFDLSSWEKPDAFNQQRQYLEEQFLTFFTDKKIIDQLKTGNSSPLVTMTIIRSMEKFIDIFDRSIKTIEGSSLYPNNDTKAAAVKSLLEPYFQLLNTLLRNLPDSAKINVDPWIRPEKYIDGYLNFIERSLNSVPSNDRALRPTPNFSVTNSALGGAPAFDRGAPQSLEDVFTLIHQNLLFTLSILSNYITPYEAITKPALFIALNDQVMNCRGTRRVFVISNPGELIARYNIPLANHCVVIDLTYQKATPSPSMITTIRFVGIRNTRWDWLELNIWLNKQAIHRNLLYTKLGDFELAIAYDFSITAAENGLRRIIDNLIGLLGVENSERILEDAIRTLENISNSIVSLYKHSPNNSSFKSGTPSINILSFAVRTFTKNGAVDQAVNLLFNLWDINKQDNQQEVLLDIEVRYLTKLLVLEVENLIADGATTLNNQAFLEVLFGIFERIYPNNNQFTDQEINTMLRNPSNVHLIEFFKLNYPHNGRPAEISKFLLDLWRDNKQPDDNFTRSILAKLKTCLALCETEPTSTSLVLENIYDVISDMVKTNTDIGLYTTSPSNLRTQLSSSTFWLRLWKEKRKKDLIPFFSSIFEDCLENCILRSTEDKTVIFKNIREFITDIITNNQPWVINHLILHIISFGYSLDEITQMLGTNPDIAAPCISTAFFYGGSQARALVIRYLNFDLEINNPSLASTYWLNIWENHKENDFYEILDEYTAARLQVNFKRKDFFVHFISERLATCLERGDRNPDENASILKNIKDFLDDVLTNQEWIQHLSPLLDQIKKSKSTSEKLSQMLGGKLGDHLETILKS